jgi:hypothetical protein
VKVGVLVLLSNVTIILDKSSDNTAESAFGAAGGYSEGFCIITSNVALLNMPVLAEESDTA